MAQQAEDRSSPLNPQVASAQHHSGLDEAMPQAVSPADRHAAHEQHDNSLIGRRLGGKQDRGYRDGKPPTDAGGASMATEPPSHALHQPSKRPSKSMRMRAQRCLEDSSDDCSEGAPQRSQPQVGLSSCPSAAAWAASFCRQAFELPSAQHSKARVSPAESQD